MNRTDWITHLERLGNPSGEAVPTLPPDRTLLAGTRGEQRLWRLCAGETAPDADPTAVIASVLGDRRGSLLAPDAFLAIEVWAECELAAVHALHRLARELRAPHLLDRAHEAILWHLEHTQPDNSTNRPWALHAFLLADGPVCQGSGDAAFYAETLLHNMSATEARNEPLSRWILADAARELRLA
jgi:hypothetical protein